MKSLYRLLCLMLWIPLTVEAQPIPDSSGTEPFSVRTLNTYEVLNTPADLANHPLMNAEVTFTAVVSGIANNTGLPAMTSPILPGYPQRLHMFVIDTLASTYGSYGMSMQIVETLNEPIHVDMAPLLLSATRGTIMTFTGRLTYAVGQVQFDLTQMPVLVGHVDDPLYAHHKGILQPHFIHTFMANHVDSLSGVMSPDMSMYTALAHSYVTLGMVEIERHTMAGVLRPQWSVSDPFGTMHIYDSSSRFRNDKDGMFWDVLNYRRANGVEGFFTPPETGSKGTVNGFVVYTSLNIAGMMIPQVATLAPWYDGVLWNGTSRSTPEWMPNDLVLDTTVVMDERFVEFRVDTRALEQLGYFDPMMDRMYIRGGFNDWQSHPMDVSSEGLYQTTIAVAGMEGDSLQYKYYYERQSGGQVFNGGWEIIGNDAMTNRLLVLGAAGIHTVVNDTFGIGLVPDPDVRPITFTVDVSSLVDAGYFDASLDSMVAIAGSFTGWGTMPMRRIGLTVWQTTINVPGPEGDGMEYKFVVGRTSGPLYNHGYEIIDIRELQTGDFYNRRVILGPKDVPMVLDPVLFGYIPILEPVVIGFPVMFEQPEFEQAANVVGFDGGTLVRVPNPDNSGINGSENVAMLIKGPGQPWAGSYFRMSQPIDPMHRMFRLSVWSPRSDARLLLKLENDTDPSQWVEQERTVGVANQWTDLVFDLRHADPSHVYQKIVLIFDLGSNGDGSTNYTFYVDDIHPTQPVEPGMIPVHLYTTSRFAPGDADGNWLYIGLGSEEVPAVDLIGMGFRLYVDTTYAMPTAYTTLGMFDDGMDEDVLDLFEFTDNGFGVSVVRTSGTNKLPYGPVIGIRFNVKEEIEWLNINITEIEIRNAAGELVPFHLFSNQISIPTRSTGIWPGDTNADGTVDVFDVEPIAYHFGAYGPSRDNRTIQWMEVDAPLWDLREQVHADATGDGVINQNDLLPVGFNFGKSIAAPVSKELAVDANRRPEAIDIALPSLRKDERIDIPLFGDPTFTGMADLRAFAFRLNVDAALLRIESIEPAAGFAVSGTMRMIKSEPELNRYSAAYSRTVSMGSMDVEGPLAVLRLRALADLPTDAVLTVDRSMTSVGDARAMPARLFTPDGTITSIDDIRATAPTSTRLQGNYPNPFNPSTIIAYEIADNAPARLSVYDVLGREVAVLVDAHQSAGSYQVVFDATGFSSGIYLIRLQVGSDTYIKRMTLVK